MRYAKAVNDRKIFRDIDNENYDPFELQGTGVHYNEKHLLDPVKHDLEKVLTRCLPLPSVTYFYKACSNVHDFQFTGSSRNMEAHTKHKTCVLFYPNLSLIHA
jgi:hypothetical protein